MSIYTIISFLLGHKTLNLVPDKNLPFEKFWLTEQNANFIFVQQLHLSDTMQSIISELECKLKYTKFQLFNEILCLKLISIYYLCIFIHEKDTNILIINNEYKPEKIIPTPNSSAFNICQSLRTNSSVCTSI